ncbi:PAS fold [Abditibacterium utsteinense]|uniref:histidine kinase n=1 Tax=Abditibacterium utsteinense TaxID=1960156 RepID=A0A2S8SPT6_9BACT|nr:sensor histidine kinase [Abditibacterium utsteinense]PQV62794.1 PAS fold [Abditibacterium utsteinense]
MKSLRTQLLASHLALVALMALVMLGAVANFLRLGGSIDRILRDNYQSVIAAQTMKESLERQDSAATFFIAGQSAKARAQFAQHVPVFEKAMAFERSNITERGEQAIADALQRDYKSYKSGVQTLLKSEPKERARFYFSSLEPRFLKIKGQAQQILDLNQAAIVRADERAKRDARQGAWSGFLMTLAALGLAIWFARRAINAALTPLLALALEAEQVGAGHLNRTIELRRDDEIGLLAHAFNDMTGKLREAKRGQETRLHRAQQMSDAALENLFDPVLVTDATRTLVHLNRAAQGLFGSAQKLTGMPLAQAIEEPKIVVAIERAIASGAVSAEEGEAALVSIQNQCLQNGGLQNGEENQENTRIYRLRATPMRDDDTVLGAVLVLEDVTHLQSLDRLKTEFIGVASHELRTPVTSLLLSAQLLEEGAVGTLTPDQLEVVAAQREDLTRLDALLRDLLDITKLEAGATPPRFEPVSPRELIEAAAKAIAAQASAKGVQLQTFSRADLPLVRADRAQIGRVLSNLLGNALRHTPGGGEIKIEAEDKTGGSGAKGVVFRVADTGDGIPAEFLGRIFERFAQVPGATRGGAGLGLPISQTILGAHGSQITVQSEVGRGSAFDFELEAQ